LQIIGHVRAEDLDKFGPNAIVRYWQIDGQQQQSDQPDMGSYFGIDPSTGAVYVRRSLGQFSLDKDRMPTTASNHLDVPIGVMASDLGIGERQKSTRSQFIIRIIGRNLHPPKFEHFAYRVALREGNPPGQELLRLKATDPDWGQNGHVEYRLAIETELISVDPDSGRVRAERTLDREELGDQFTMLGLPAT
jgi:hypothetical protein